MDEQRRPAGGGSAGGSGGPGGAGGSGGAGGGRKGPRVFTVSFTLPKMVFSIVLAAMLFSWSFIFGIILGRGMSPEDSIPQLAEVMPPPLETTGADKGYLKQEEMAYYTNLKSTETPARPPAQQPRAQQAQTPPPPAVRSNTTQPAPAPARQAQAAPKPTPSGGEQFDYVYQVAAFKDNASADRLLTRLKQQGLRAEVLVQTQGDTTWYRAVVHFRGEPEDTRTLREALVPLGINQILLKSKTPVKKR